MDPSAVTQGDLADERQADAEARARALPSARRSRGRGRGRGRRAHRGRLRAGETVEDARRVDPRDAGPAVGDGQHVGRAQYTTGELATPGS